LIRLWILLRRATLRIFRTLLQRSPSRKIQHSSKLSRPHLSRGGILSKILSSQNSRIKRMVEIYRFCSKMTKVKDFRR